MSETGATSELPVVDVGPVAHGGHCVARLDGQVVFVRHTLPGERVRIRITERSKRFLRADAVEVLDAAPDRVAAPCRYAGDCGGCDFQHVSPAGQRRLLTSVVREQLDRLAGLTWEGEVEAVEPDDLGWRTRVGFAVDEAGPGRAASSSLARRRADRGVPHRASRPAARARPHAGTRSRWRRSSPRPANGCWSPTPPSPTRSSARSTVSSRSTARCEVAAVHSPSGCATTSMRVSGSGFWQVHPAAAVTLVDAVLEAAEVRAGETVVDLYAGVGLFTSFLADAVGEQGTVVSVESDRRASRDARRNLHDRPQVRLVGATVEQALGVGTVRVGRRRGARPTSYRRQARRRRHRRAHAAPCRLRGLRPGGPRP